MLALLLCLPWELGPPMNSLEPTMEFFRHSSWGSEALRARDRWTFNPCWAPGLHVGILRTQWHFLCHMNKGCRLWLLSCSFDRTRIARIVVVIRRRKKRRRRKKKGLGTRKRIETRRRRRKTRSSACLSWECWPLHIREDFYPLATFGLTNVAELHVDDGWGSDSQGEYLRIPYLIRIAGWWQIMMTREAGGQNESDDWLISLCVRPSSILYEV